MRKTIVDDGFASFLVEGAEFDGEYEIPIIRNSFIEHLPERMLPFSKRHTSRDLNGTCINFYEHDIYFNKIIMNIDRFIRELKVFGSVVSTDCSIYRDMPRATQIGNTYINRAIGFYLQQRGISIIPNVRWSDERSFDFAFDGLEPRGIYALGTVGCMKSKIEKEFFRAGLEEFIYRLCPNKVLVYGSMPGEIFNDFAMDTEFIQYEGATHRAFRERLSREQLSLYSRNLKLKIG